MSNSTTVSVVSIRVPESMLNDIDDFKSRNALKYAGSRSKACVDLLAMGLYETDTSAEHVTNSFNKRIHNLIILITMFMLFASVVTLHAYVEGSLKWELYSLMLMVVFGFCAVILAEQLVVRFKDGS
tara:strand:+ start:338 stop:718 length:381 start_codon:yes stop_codon:yes gene_type:complete